MLTRDRIAVVPFFASALLVSICLTCLASAQTPPSAVHVGQTVWVNTVDGREMKGKVASVSATEIRVQTGQAATPFLWPQVRLIETPDSIRNGLVKGAIIGGLSGLALTFANDCSSNECGEGFYVPGGAAIGAAAGTGIDLLVHKRRVLYRAQGQTSLRFRVLVGQVTGAKISWRF
jgi:hypothetical protein